MLVCVCVPEVLCLAFVSLGKVDLEELISAFMDLGIEMDRQEAKKLLKR